MIFINKNNLMIKQFQNTLDVHGRQIEYIKQGIEEELKHIHSEEIKPTMVQKCVLVLMELTKLKQSVNQFKATINTYQDIKNKMNNQINRLEAEYENYMGEIKQNFEKIEKNMEENGAFKNLEQLKIFETIKMKDDEISKLSKRIQFLQSEDQKLRNVINTETQNFRKVKQILQNQIQQLKKNNTNKDNNSMITQQFKEDSQCKFKFTDDNQECVIFWDEKSSEKQIMQKKSPTQNIDLRQITQQDEQAIQVYNITQVPSKSSVYEDINTDRQVQNNFQDKQCYNTLSARQLKLNTYENQQQESFRIDTQMQEKINNFVNGIATTQKGLLKQKFENKLIIKQNKNLNKHTEMSQTSRSSRCNITQNSKAILSNQFKTALKQFKLKKKENYSYFK